MIRFILLSGYCAIVFTCPVQADVIEFQGNGSVVRHEAKDYRQRVRLSNVSYVPKLTAKYKKKYNQYINDASIKYGVNSDLIRAVILVESSFNKNAISPKGAIGLMQLMPKTAHSLGVEDSYNPQQNIDGGTKYLKQLLNKYGGNTMLALAAYNAGEKAVDKYDGVPPYRETMDYVAKIDVLARSK